MAQIQCIVTNLPWEAHHRAKLEAAAPGTEILYVDPADMDALRAALPKATVALLGRLVDPKIAPDLQWLHLDAAGLDSIAKPGFIDSGFAITGSAGRSAPALAEHCFYFMLTHAYHNRTILAAQAAHQWGYPGQNDMKALYSQTVGIIGMGNTGRALVPRAKAFEMRVIAYSRKAYKNPGIDVMLSEENGDSVDTLFRESDYIIMTAALTDKTYHMIDERAIGLMKPSAFIVNIGRGKTIDEQALLAALKDGRIAGAGLDTFETEPLPPDSPVWDAPNLTATPHFTPACPDKLGRSLDIMLENVRRYLADEPLINRLMPEDKFSK
ncbi:D-2-hydroxyacid dehydrogenase [Eubacteriales bacterium OttesenSCG-928-A19]|nr:D-2-hydroxyacid dehydrogenase [Eubacteriales bacterium OttesenSCG-928-A19]